MGKTKQPANIVGKEIQKRRYELGLTQEQFAAKCQLHGLDISRGTVSQIEAQVRCVSDSELLLLASVLGVSTDSLYPSHAVKAKRKRQP
jgi:transcriptional regulator with XRE-family HTH domain